MADDPMAVTNSEGSDEIAAADPYADAPVVKLEAPPEGEPQKVVPALPPNAEEGEVTRTAGPSAQATLEANVGVGPTATNGGIADAALGQHTKGENEPIDAMVNVVGGISRGALG